MKKLSFEEIQSSKPSIQEVQKMKRIPIYVVLDNIRSMYNVGAIFRTSDALLVAKIYLCGITASPPRPQIEKTSLGACDVVPWEYREDARAVIDELKGKGVEIVAVELAQGAKSYSDAQYAFPVCFVFGHEVDGVSGEIMDRVDYAISLPMLGRANSLNVATCYGIVVYSAYQKYLENQC